MSSDQKNKSDDNKIINNDSIPTLSNQPSSLNVPNNTEYIPPHIQKTTSSSSDSDLQKALTFLLSKEMQEYSIEKKKEFLLSKLPSETVEKALSVFPLIESKISTKIKELKQEGSHESFFSFLPSLGVLSSVLLSTLGLNYLLDLNRNKKNDLFYKECEKRINDDLQKLSKDIRSEISTELNEYVTKESFKEKVNSQIVEYSHQRGLNLNLSTKSVKEEIVKIKEDIITKDKFLKDIEVKIENNKVLLKSEIIRETNQIMEENNNKMLMKIIENQDKLLTMVTNAIKSSNRDVTNFNQSDGRDFVKKNEYGTATQKVSHNSSNIYDRSSATEIMTNMKNNFDVDNSNYPPNNSNNPPNNSNNLSNNSNNIDGFIFNIENISSLLIDCINSIKEEKDNLPFIKQLKNQFSAIAETLKKDSSGKDSLPFINITNRVYKTVENSLLSNFLKASNFANESGSIFKFKGLVEDLTKIIEIFNQHDN